MTSSRMRSGRETATKMPSQNNKKMMNTLGERLIMTGIRRGKEIKKVYEETKYTKESLEKMSLKSLNKIKIKSDDVYKMINRRDHFMTKGFKSIKEINRLIDAFTLKKKQSINKYSTTMISNNNIMNINEDDKEHVFEIDPKIFEPSEEAILWNENKHESKITNEKD